MALIAEKDRAASRVVGEGVETLSQERLLQDQGCDELQGFRYGEPCSAEVMAGMIAADRRLPVQDSGAASGSS